MFKQVGPIARNLGRAALLLGCTTSVACSTSDVDRDATTDTSADREEPSDTSADRDATSDASADASTADAGRDASGDGPACSNVAGSYFVDEMGTGRPRRTYCIRQYGCSATIAVDGAIVNGVVAGNVLTVNNPAERCEMTFSGRTAVERCTTFGGGTTSTYSTTLTARTLPGATSYCCDLNVATSCGAGQRCVPGNDATTSANLTFTACVPNGTLAEGMPCMRTDGLIGVDMCVAGTICANIRQPTPTMRVCRRVCGENSNCGPGEICRRLGDAPSSGFCTATCTLGGTDCPTGNTCRTEIAIRHSVLETTDDLDQVRTACAHFGTTAMGMPCSDGTQCEANTDCFFDPEVADGPSICRRTCGPMLACPAGQTCRPRREAGPQNPDGLGHCYPS